MKCCFPLWVTALTAGCADLPKDPEGTLERVRSERRFRLGVIDSTMPDPTWSAGAAAFADWIAAKTAARPNSVRGATEPLLAQLEAGKLDLVIGPMAPTSPWEKQVSVLPALAEHVGPDEHLRLVPVARNGENAWIGLLHREALAVRAGR
jgi:DNA-binding transcriptional LysR family regulator